MLFHLRSIAMLLRSMTVCIFTIGASGRKATVPSRAKGSEEEVGVDLEEGSWWWVEWDVIDNCCGCCCCDCLLWIAALAVIGRFMLKEEEDDEVVVVVMFFT